MYRPEGDPYTPTEHADRPLVVGKLEVALPDQSPFAASAVTFDLDDILPEITDDELIAELRSRRGKIARTTTPPGTDIATVKPGDLDVSHCPTCYGVNLVQIGEPKEWIKARLAMRFYRCVDCGYGNDGNAFQVSAWATSNPLVLSAIVNIISAVKNGVSAESIK